MSDARVAQAPGQISDQQSRNTASHSFMAVKTHPSMRQRGCFVAFFSHPIRHSVCRVGCQSCAGAWTNSGSAIAKYSFSQHHGSKTHPSMRQRGCFVAFFSHPTRHSVCRVGCQKCAGAWTNFGSAFAKYSFSQHHGSKSHLACDREGVLLRSFHIRDGIRCAVSDARSAQSNTNHLE